MKLCLEAGKHVLCEKPFTVNAEQAQIIVELAKQKYLFVAGSQDASCRNRFCHIGDGQDSTELGL
jgi:predicted dehydrogenase